MQKPIHFLIGLTILGVCAAGCGSSEDATNSGGATPQLSLDDLPATPEAPKAPTSDPFPVVQLRTDFGDIVVRLNREKAPLTVQNFLDYVNKGHYDNTIFHHVRSADIVMGGAFTPDLQEKPGESAIRNEAQNGLRNKRGTIAMARDLGAIDSSTCQFFFNLADNSYLDPQPHDKMPHEHPEKYGFCVFGQVVDAESLKVLDRIGQAEVEKKGEAPFDSIPKRTVRIKRAVLQR